MQSNVLYLIRGLPGSGKSTLAESIHSTDPRESVVVEADHFFLSTDGNFLRYHFDRRLLGAAHDEAYGRAMRFLWSGKNVIVANSFSTNREIDRYVGGVQRCDLPVKIKIIKCVNNFGSIHGVPNRVIENMRNRWEDVEGEVTFNGDYSTLGPEGFDDA